MNPSEPDVLLDPPTLLFITAIIIAFSGLLLFSAYRAKTGTQALGIWAAAMLTGAFGLVLGGIANQWPGMTGLVIDTAGTAMILLATAISWTAARLFREKRPILPAIIAGAAFWLATVPWHTSAQWAGLSSVIGTIYTLATVYELWRTVPEPLPSRPAAMFLLLLHATVFAINAARSIALNQPPSTNVTALLVLETLLQTNGMAFLLLAMVKERLELRTNDQLRALTRLDGLTGIGNRRHFDERLSMEIRRAARRGPTLALLLIDVDHFKSYNDAMGHQQGDRCLRAVAQAIARQVRRPGDLAARYGGEEFAVVLANTDPEGALGLAERMRATIEGMAIANPGSGGVVTISVGVALLFLPAAAPTAADDLVNMADRALYEAKYAGRNRVQAAWRPAADRLAG